MTACRTAPRMRPLGVVVAALLLWLGATTIAAGHAQLLGTTPASGTVVERAPASIELRFNEAVSVRAGAVRLLGPDGAELRLGRVERPDGERVVVRPSRPLAAGTHTVAWRVTSADTHPVGGAFTFSVGHATAAPATPAATATAGAPRWAVVTVRALDLVLICLLPGGAWALVLCVRKAEGRATWPPRGAAAAGALMMPVAAAAIALQSIDAAGAMGEGLSPGALGAVVGSDFGPPWLGRMAIGAAVVVAALAPRRDPRRRLVVIGLVATPLVALPGLAGHSRSDGGLSLVADTVHVAAAALWVGGLAAIGWWVWRGRGSSGRAAGPGPIVAFSRLALAAVVAVGVTGAALATLRLERVGDLLHTPFGRLVLAKGVLLVVLIGLGAAQRRTVVAGLGAAAAWPRRRFLRLAGGELAVMATVLALTAVLVTTAPPRAGGAVGVPTVPRPVDTAVAIGAHRARVVVTPAVVGVNRIDVYLRDGNGALVGADEVRLIGRLPERDITGIVFAVRADERGHFVAPRARIPLAGGWRLDLSARFGEFEIHTGTVTVPIGQER